MIKAEKAEDSEKEIRSLKINIKMLFIKTEIDIKSKKSNLFLIVHPLE